MKNCIDYESLIPEYLDGELDGTQLAEFEEHIKGCASCKKALEEAQVLFGDIRDCAKEVPAELKKRVMDEVNLDIRAKNSRRSRFVRIAGSVAACLVVVIGIAAVIPHINDGGLLFDKKEEMAGNYDGNTSLNQAPTASKGEMKDEEKPEFSINEDAPSEMEPDGDMAFDEPLDDFRGDANVGSSVPDGALSENYGESTGAIDPGASVGSLTDKSETAEKENELTSDVYNEYSTTVEDQVVTEDLGAFFMTRGAAKLAELLEEMQ